MKFSQEKFMSLPGARRLKKVYDYLLNLNQTTKPQPAELDFLQQVSNWLTQHNQQTDLGSVLQTYLQNPTVYTRQHCLAAIEQKMQLSLYDHALSITSQDGTNPTTAPLPLYFVLVDLRSAYNTGAYFRLAECLNVAGIILCGCTPGPNNPRLARTAMGTSNKVNWQHFSQPQAALSWCHQQGITTYALETATNAQDLYQTAFTHPLALVAGNEALGLPPELVQACNQVVQIPMRGWKNSLNVAVAGAVAAYEFLRQYQP